MIEKNTIPLGQLCKVYEMEDAFFIHLNEHGLIELQVMQEELCIAEDDLHELERMIRLYHELHINAEGIDVALHLMKKIIALQQELAETRCRLALYEE